MVIAVGTIMLSMSELSRGGITRLEHYPPV
jgi:hypothetical protein